MKDGMYRIRALGIVGTLVLVAGLLALTPLAAQAGATLTVTTTADESNVNGTCSLREAITNANADDQSGSTDCAAGSGADTIDFSVVGTITLGTALPSITGDLTISGPGASSLTISGGGLVRVLSMGAVTVNISGVTLTDGSAANGGGIQNDGGTLSIHDATLSDNVAISGGGIENDGGTLALTGSTVSGSTGGGIVNTGSVSLTGSVIKTSTWSQLGGQLIVGGQPINYNLMIAGLGTAFPPRPPASGSSSVVSVGLACVPLGAGSLSGVVALVQRGGCSFAVKATNAAGAGATAVVIYNNVSGPFQGSMATTAVPIPSVGISDTDGLFIAGQPGTPTLTWTPTAGAPASFGGGIVNLGTLNMTNSTLSGNDSAVNGGGIESTGTTSVTDSTLSDNASFGNNGGGIFVAGGATTVTDSTLSGNSASNGGGIFSLAGTIDLTRAIVANSPSGSDCQGAITDDGYNLDSDGTCGFSGTSLSGVDPMLQPLASNGGPTQTLLPAAGSPAIDAAGGLCSGADQRGVARPQGKACDIGAVEVRWRSDAMLALPPGSSFVGNNIYNTTGKKQAVVQKIFAGQTRSELIRVQNDGEVPDSFKIKGGGGQGPLSVTYQDGATDVTGQVEAGTFSTPTLAPGASYTISLTWTAAGSIPKTKQLIWKIKATSMEDTSSIDAVNATAKVIAS